MTYAQDLDRRISEAVKANDTEALDSLLQEHFQKAETQTRERPYDAAIELRPDFREELVPGPYEGDAVINWANRIARARRLVDYRLKTFGGFAGARIVEEGDSWFQYPLLLDDVIDHFNEERDFAVYSLAAAGDLVEHMAVRREYHDALIKTGSRVLLLSGGGNDLLGEGRLTATLNPYEEGASPDDLINQDTLEAISLRILGYYREILTDVDRNHPGVTVFGHGYDIPFPKQGGNHFGRPFEEAGIPLNVGRDVIAQIVSYFRDQLAALANDFANFRFIDLTGTVGDHPNSWSDELHPTNSGFERAAKPMIAAVREHLAQLPAGGFETVTVPIDAETSGTAESFEARGRKTVVLDPGHGGTVSNSSSWNNAVGPSGTLEKTWTLDVCLRAKPLLEDRGYRVLLTREADVNPSLADRRRVARDAASDCFVSVHFNASDRHNAQGTETYIHKNARSARSEHLMRTVQASMVAELGHKDRNRSREPSGVLRGSYGVINERGHHRNTAACLHEVSFMDRIDEENRIKQRSYRDRIARAIVDGIDNYFADGFERRGTALATEDEGFEDAIHARAAEQGLTIVQYLGFAEAPSSDEAQSFERLEPDDARGLGHLGGGMLPDSDLIVGHSDMIDAMLAETSAASRSVGIGPDENEDRYIDVAEGFNFSILTGDRTRDRAVLAGAFSNFEAARFDYDDFADFIEDLRLTHFKPREFLFLGNSNLRGQCAGKNSPPPRRLWSKLANTAKMIDKIRNMLGYEVNITSAYRSERYNSCIGGEPESYHSKFNALDWTCPKGSVADWYAAAESVRDSDSSFSGGIGRYDRKNFIHIDTRGTDWKWRKP